VSDKRDVSDLLVLSPHPSMTFAELGQ